ncbi:hypothetical protein MESS4_60099 [Mesorhizobium sp. STM 4661]|nr:hypothetical protein MESS4_60099 [Mesorhizobium sp. STM 4661]
MTLGVCQVDKSGPSGRPQKGARGALHSTRLRVSRLRLPLPSESGLWCVIDSLTGLPAERYGRPLTGLTRYEAEEAAFNLSESTPPWMALVRRRRR